MDKSLAWGRKIQKFKPRCHLRGITIPGGKLRFGTPRRPVFEFQPGVGIVQGDAYHVINQAGYRVPFGVFNSRARQRISNIADGICSNFRDAPERVPTSDFRGGVLGLEDFGAVFRSVYGFIERG